MGCPFQNEGGAPAPDCHKVYNFYYRLQKDAAITTQTHTKQFKSECRPRFLPRPSHPFSLLLFSFLNSDSDSDFPKRSPRLSIVKRINVKPPAMLSLWGLHCCCCISCASAAPNPNQTNYNDQTTIMDESELCVPVWVPFLTRSRGSVPACLPWPADCSAPPPLSLLLGWLNILNTTCLLLSANICADIVLFNGTSVQATLREIMTKYLKQLYFKNKHPKYRIRIIQQKHCLHILRQFSMKLSSVSGCVCTTFFVRA